MDHVTQSVIHFIFEKQKTKWDKEEDVQYIESDNMDNVGQDDDDVDFDVVSDLSTDYFNCCVLCRLWRVHHLSDSSL